MRDKGKRAPENIFQIHIHTLSVSNEVVKESIIMQNEEEKKHTHTDNILYN